MNINTKSAHITPVGGNVFSDLGFDPVEATELKAETDRIISEKMRIKEQLMSEISRWMTSQHLKQAEAAEILGITRPRVSDVIHKKAIKFTIDSLVDMLARTGQKISVQVA